MSKTHGKVIYLAASWPRREYANSIKTMMDARYGIGWVQSDWLDPKITKDLSEEANAVRDLVQARDCGIMVQITGDKLSSGGRHTELGIALALDIPVIILGPKEQVFHNLPGIRFAKDMLELFTILDPEFK